MMEISAFCNRGNFTQCLTYSVALFVYVNGNCVCARVQMCVGVDVVSTVGLKAGSATMHTEVRVHCSNCRSRKFPHRNDDASTNYSAQPVSYIFTKRGTPPIN